MGALPKPGPLRDAIASSIAREVKAYDVAAFCEGLGLAAQREGEDPFRSKFTYVKSRLQERRLPELIDMARTVLAEWDDDDLEQLLASAGATGVAGELKNLIFASTGPKPQIVLRDALNNTVEITKGADTCLIYTKPLPEAGLTWADLAEWWATEVLHDSNLDVAQRHLYQRLYQSLASPPEELLFRTYADRFVATPRWPPCCRRCTCTTTPTCGGGPKSDLARSCGSAWTSCSCCRSADGSSSRSTGVTTTPQRTAPPIPSSTPGCSPRTGGCDWLATRCTGSVEQSSPTRSRAGRCSMRSSTNCSTVARSSSERRPGAAFGGGAGLRQTSPQTLDQVLQPRDGFLA
jgi:hypothetical protein